ncbi:unnamed protein product [Euphydryas editha]|uniref:Uncharacterized protein n=1 Tax=Euphydryas editha TaxID=104508 RepID=A0AAU9TZV6_EUPED|nr:unnamed protein product [Euphydryas editha]
MRYAYPAAGERPGYVGLLLTGSLPTKTTRCPLSSPVPGLQVSGFVCKPRRRASSGPYTVFPTMGGARRTPHAPTRADSVDGRLPQVDRPLPGAKGEGDDRAPASDAQSFCGGGGGRWCPPSPARPPPSATSLAQRKRGRRPSTFRCRPWRKSQPAAKGLPLQHVSAPRAPRPKPDTPPARAVPTRRNSPGSGGNEERAPSQRPDTGTPRSIRAPRGPAWQT